MPQTPGGATPAEAMSANPALSEFAERAQAGGRPTVAAGTSGLGMAPDMSSPGSEGGMRGPGARVLSDRLRQVQARRRQGGSPGQPGGGEAELARLRAWQGSGGRAGVPPAVGQPAAAGQPAGEKSDRSWMPWAGLLGGGYLANQYATEGGTWSPFDPPEIRRAKKISRNKAFGIDEAGNPIDKPTASSGMFKDDFDARDQMHLETFLKRYRGGGHSQPTMAARDLWGNPGQANTQRDFFEQMQARGLQPRIESQWGKEEWPRVLQAFQEPTTGQGQAFHG